MEMWLRAMMASMVSARDRVRHFLRTVVTSAATSCSARLLWLEMSMTMTSKPLRTDSVQLQKNRQSELGHFTDTCEAQMDAHKLTHPLVFSMRSTAAGIAPSRPFEPSGVAEPMLAKISSII